MTFTTLSELDDRLQAVLFHSRERRRSLAGIPELFRTHRFVGGSVMAVANIVAATFPVRTGEVTFKTAIRVDENTSARAGLVFEFGDSTTGVAIWIEDQKIGFRAGGATGASTTFDNGAQWPAGLELEIVAAIRPGFGLIELWLNGKSVLKTNSTAFAEWAASSAGSFAAAVQGTTPADVVQTGAPTNFAVIEPLSVYIGSRPRQMLGPTAFSPLSLSPVLWLDASDTSTILHVANKVSAWSDKSTTGANMLQGTASMQPTTNTNTINGLNVVNFDGSADFMNASVSASFKQVFAVAILETGNLPFSAIFGSTVGESESIRIEGATSNWRVVNDPNDFARATGEIRVNGAVALAIVKGTAFLLSQVHPGTAAIFSPQLSVPSFSRFWKGDIAELIGFSTVLSTADRGDLQNYLAAKWGITLA